MGIDLVIAALVGIGAGIFTGLVPGIHVNLVSVLLITLSSSLLGFASPLALATFIISLGITHTFLDSIPSIFLGAPDADMVMGVLPGHRLLLEGRGFEAVKLTVVGSFLSLLGTLLVVPLLIPVFPFLHNLIEPYLAYLLILVILFMVWKEKGLRKMVWALIVFFLSGVLGIVTLGWPNLNQPLFPLLSGLFGVSTLLLSLQQNVKIPPQSISDTIKIDKLSQTKAIGAAMLSGGLAGLLPGLGSAQAAILAMELVPGLNMFAFLILIGGINTVNFAVSLVTLYTLGKARNGAVVAVLELLKSISTTQLLIFLGTALFAGSIATLLTLFIAKKFAVWMEKVNYRKLCLMVISFITILSSVFDGFLGLLILGTSTALGLLAPLLGIKRSNAMGCLLLPVILFFLL
ncbi:tripartite tricarboxylate transporter permease [Candidatus Woesearchaeota archaeon]|nr:tripartite tricarboxylate transporter permease [Candidatus Woesearchaeota archaeon]